MRKRPDKKKMKRFSEIAERVKRLRTALGMTQVVFGELIRADPSRISEWEAGKRKPTGENYMALGNLAPYPDSLWFWQQAGLDRNAMLSSAGGILEERARPGEDVETVRVPLVRQSAAGLEAAGPLVSLPAGFIDNTASTICLITRQTLDLGQRRTVIVLDNSKTELHSLWEEVVLVDLKAHAAEWIQAQAFLPKPPEQIIGLLRKEIHFDAEGLWWFAELWSEHGYPLASTLKIASWQFPYSHKPRRNMFYMPSSDEMASLHEKSARQLPTHLKLMPGIRILGRVIGWFRLPREE